MPAFDLTTTLVTIVGVMAVVLGVVAYLVLAERKVSAYMQDRIGPNRNGPFGLAQPIIDGAKMFLKEDIVPTHLVATPDPNVTVARAALPLPVEVIVRGYITGVTDTSLWRQYAGGMRRIYGHDFPEGLRKNTALPAAIITPTTKAAAGGHDEPLSSAEVVERGLVDAPLWERTCDAARSIFARGQAVAESGLHARHSGIGGFSPEPHVECSRHRGFAPGRVRTRMVPTVAPADAKGKGRAFANQERRQRDQ